MEHLILETSVVEAQKVQDILRDLNLESIFDLKIERIYTNIWQFEVEFGDQIEEIKDVLKECGLNDFELYLHENI